MAQGRKHMGIADVAARAGVSVTTVSHVLSQRRPVSEATRQKVLAAVDELGYHPNGLARSMRTQRTNTIGLVVPDITNPFYPAIARGMRDVLAPAGYLIVVCDTDGDPVMERFVVEQMIARRLDGLAFGGYYLHAADVAPAVNAGVPVVLFGQRRSQRGIDAVNCDDFGAGMLATEHLLSQGHQRIGYVTGPAGQGPPADRVDGYLAALAAADIQHDPRLIARTQFSRDGGEAGMLELLDLPEPPQAVVCTNDIVAIGALAAAQSRGKRVPDDIAIIGYDDIEAASLVSPALTTVLIPAREEGRACGRLLLHRLTESDQQPPQSVSFSASLIRRQSA